MEKVLEYTDKKRRQWIVGDWLCWDGKYKGEIKRIDKGKTHKASYITVSWAEYDFNPAQPADLLDSSKKIQYNQG